MTDFYKILEVDEKASLDEIKKSYRKLSLKYHPDKNPNTEEKFKQISEAYETLGDVDRKREYDMKKNSPFSNSSFPARHGNPQQMDDIMKMFFSGGIPGMNVHGNMANNIKIFRNGQPVNINTLNKPSPIVKQIVISLEQAYNGDQVSVNIERWLFEDNIRKCENETIYVPIKKGIDNKEIIILKDKGNILDNNLKGDVKIIINIQNTTEFIRNGLNLHLNKEVSLKEALCGFEFIIPHLNGKSLKFTNEKGKILTNGLERNIANYGMERDNHKGSLCIKFSVKFPDKLTDEQIDKLSDILQT
jgi:DnaJ-class molecular chaperone